MNGITLKQLRYFESLAIAGHFGRAAEMSGVTQPALSVQIKDLETSLGAPLFERGPRQIRLTAFGQTVRGRCREILRSVDELGDLARAAQDGPAGQLRLGVIPTIAPYLLPRMIQNLGAAFPDLDLRLRESVTPTLVRELADGQLDAAILALPISEPNLRELPLFEESFLLVRPERDAHLPVPGAEGLRAMRLLLLEEGHCFRDQALSFCNLQSAAPREVMDGSSLATLVQMVGAGIGVTLIPEMAVDVETRSAEVSVSRFAAPEPKRTIGMVWRKSTPIADQLMQVAEAMGPGLAG